MTRIWPSMTDYAGAVQNPGDTFRLPALARANFATMPPLGLPAIASGQNAVVFTAHIGTSSTAVRCFTSECADGRHRYRSLEHHLRSNQVPAMASASWVDDAIELNGHLWPIVTMEWVHGQQLHEYVAENSHSPAVLSALADEWADICQSLRSAAVAHGDLQHGNVIVEPGGRIRLIDFDGIWVQDVKDSPPSEVGHPNYQHPARKDTGAWGWSIDWFSALGVYLTLRALASDRSLWDLHMGENLIFREEDFWGDAEIWSRLERSGDQDVRAWSQLLAQGCAHPADSPYDLSTILNSGLVAGSGPATSGSGSEVAGSSGGASAKPATEPDVSSQTWWGGPMAAEASVPEASRPPVTEPVRPPVRERPQQQHVHSAWGDSAGAGRTGALPAPPPPPPPRINVTAPASHMAPPAGPPPPPGAPAPAARGPSGPVNAIASIMLVLMVLAVVVAVLILAGGR